MAVFKCTTVGYGLIKETLLAAYLRPTVVPVRNNMYGPRWKEPIRDAKELQKLVEDGELYKFSHVPILPARTLDNFSLYNDPVVRKFTNYLMRDGMKDRAQKLVLKMFERIKRYQVQKYHKEQDPVEKAKIEVDPMKIFHAAVNNCKPLLQLNSIKRGGQRYQVPTPITPERSSFLAMNWLIEAGRMKDRKTIWSEQMAQEMMDAAENKGRVVKKKQDIHKQCEANRAYAHYRWN